MPDDDEYDTEDSFIDDAELVCAALSSIIAVLSSFAYIVHVVCIVAYAG